MGRPGVHPSTHHTRSAIVKLVPDGLNLNGHLDYFQRVGGCTRRLLGLTYPVQMQLEILAMQDLRNGGFVNEDLVCKRLLDSVANYFIFFYRGHVYLPGSFHGHP